MTKEDFEIFIAERSQEVKARGITLFNAVGATMKDYNAERSVSNLRNMEAARDALERFVAEQGGGVSGDLFDNLAAVLEYLKNSGWKIGRSNLYNHHKSGRLLAGPDGKFARRSVDKYADTFLKRTDTGKRVQEDIDGIQHKIQKQLHALNELKIKREARRDAVEEKKLVPVQAVLDRAFAMFRHTRDSLLNIPDRITDILAAETDPVRVREILTRELRNAMENLESPEDVLES